MGKKPKDFKEKNSKNDVKEQENELQSYRKILVIITLIGLIIRFFLLAVLPEDAFYKSDHMAIWSWWRNSVEKGLFHSYSYNRPNIYFTYGKPISVQVQKEFYGPDGRFYKPGEIIELPGRPWTGIPINYPPLTAYIIHLQGIIHRLLDQTMEPLTFKSWCILEIPAYLGDWFLALGCMCMVQRFRSRRWGLMAFILIWFCPGILLTGVLWGQTDSWFLAPAIWCIYFCIGKRWVLCGLLWGCAVMIKPQSLFMVPVMAYFFFTQKSLKPFIIYLLTSLLVILILVFPFMCYSGFAWFDNTYLANFRGSLVAYTTLEGLNLWMIDLILRDHDASIYSTIFGITKKTWGLFFIVIGLTFCFIACYRRYKKHDLAILMLLALTFAVIFLFSTQVHERFVIYILPFLVISACIEGFFWLIFTGYSIIAIFEMTNHYTLPPCLNLQGASSTGLTLLILLSIISLCLFFYWLYSVWRYKSSFIKN